MYLHEGARLSRFFGYEQEGEGKPPCSGLNSYLRPHIEESVLFGKAVLADFPRVINLQCFQSTDVCFVMVLMPLTQSQHVIHLLHMKYFPAFHMLLFPRAYCCDSASVILRASVIYNQFPNESTNV